MPSLYAKNMERSFKRKPWYFGDITKSETEKLLLTPTNQNGTFLIRYSESDPSAYTLSIRHDNSVLNLRITQLPGGFKFRQKAFTSLDEFVQYLKDEHLIDGVQVRLDGPCVITEKPKIGVSLNKLRRLEISRDFLKIDKINGKDIVLGSGNFGKVKKGSWNYPLHNWIPVAIKSLKPGKMKSDDFFNEAKVMVNLKHKNLVRLYGICMKKEPYFIVTELMAGSLSDYLRMGKSSLGLSELTFFATQISSGMAYLESRRFIHRDLAARNILIKDHDQIKIADFGLARYLKEDVYVSRNKTFPIRWTAPEAASKKQFSAKSDVWSFGVVLHELWSYGRLPYSKFDNDEVLENIALGYRMPCPVDCPDQVYSVMLKCWHKEPHRRPDFKTMQAMFEYYLEKFNK